MPTCPPIIYNKHPVILKVSTRDVPAGAFRRLGFSNSLQTNILCTVRSGGLITANSAACKLPGYLNKELMTKSNPVVFDVNEGVFKKILKYRMAQGKAIALVKA